MREHEGDRMKLAALVAIALGAVLVSAGATAAEVIPNPATQAHTLDKADLESWLDGFVPYALDTGDIAGGVVAVVKDGELLFA
jgi:hypothetical protein